MSVIIKFGAKHSIFFKVSSNKIPVDLTGITSPAIRLIKNDTKVETLLSCTASGNPAEGILEHQLDGTLARGSYMYDLILENTTVKKFSPTAGYGELVVQ